jgi:hypothetical protein
MSAMASKATVVWLRDELRVHDNALLAEAARRGAPVLPVFCLDPRVFDASATSGLGASQKTGARRAKFVLESLEDLRGSVRKSTSRCSCGDAVAAMAWGVRTLISTQARLAQGSRLRPRRPPRQPAPGPRRHL